MNTPEYEYLATLKRGKPAAPANIPVIAEADATGELADAYERFRERFGRPDVPGILQCFSSSPVLLRQVMEMASTLLFSDGLLGRRHKEMIATSVSMQNACPYCADSHGFFLSVHGAEEAAVSALMDGGIGDGGFAEESLSAEVFSAPERALLRFARKVTAESWKVTPRDIEELRDEGWSDGQIAEAVHLAAAFAFFNRVANAFGLASQGLLALHPEPVSSGEFPFESRPA